ncbi:MAG: ABC transporter ATP-binding protein, partial [Spirochaetales bacterium]|nr:ABC transporter ATP-binding protein [Spirochaetales bacterium]
KVRSRNNGEIVEQVVSLDSDDTGDRLKSAVSTPDLMTIHTEEATLEDIFVKLTGRRLA